MRHTINNMEESLAVKSSRKGHFLYNSALSQSCASSPSLPSCALSGGQNCLSLCSSFQLLLRCWPTSWPTATDTQHEYTSHPFLVPLHRFCCAPVTEKEELPLNKIEVKKMLVCNPGSCPIHLLFLHTHTHTRASLSLSLSLYPPVISFSCSYWLTASSVSHSLSLHSTRGNNRNLPYLF